LLRKVIVGVGVVLLVVGEDALEDIDSAVGLQAVSFGGVGGEGSLPA
jgi:hypothetical protein